MSRLTSTLLPKKFKVCLRIVLLAIIIGTSVWYIISKFRLPSASFRPGSRNSSKNLLWEQDSVKSIVLIPSEAEHVIHRHILRFAWSSTGTAKDLGILTKFIIGSVEDDFLHRLIDWEKEFYGDVLQTSFPDNYKEMVERKVLEGIKWAVSTFPKLMYIIKAEDDVFINVYSLTEYLHSKDKSIEKNLYCYVMPYSSIETNISKSINLKYQGPYCSKEAYIMPLSVANLLMNQSDSINFINNVYLTGLLAKESEVKHEHIGYRYILSNNYTNQNLPTDIFFVHADGEEGHVLRAKMSQWLKSKKESEKNH